MLNVIASCYMFLIYFRSFSCLQPVWLSEIHPDSKTQAPAEIRFIAFIISQKLGLPIPGPIPKSIKLEALLSSFVSLQNLGFTFAG